jgi:hypothetical protein
MIEDSSNPLTQANAAEGIKVDLQSGESDRSDEM